MLPRIASSSSAVLRISGRRYVRVSPTPTATQGVRAWSSYRTTTASSPRRIFPRSSEISSSRAFSGSTTRCAAPQPADDIVDTLTELYGTARDEFEIAAEETEKKTVYAADDRDAAREAFAELKTAFEEAIKTSDPGVGKEVQGRVGQRVRELENALTALEESAMED